MHILCTNKVLQGPVQVKMWVKRTGQLHISKCCGKGRFHLVLLQLHDLSPHFFRFIGYEIFKGNPPVSEFYPRKKTYKKPTWCTVYHSSGQALLPCFPLNWDYMYSVFCITWNLQSSSSSGCDEEHQPGIICNLYSLQIVYK